MAAGWACCLDRAVEEANATPLPPLEAFRNAVQVYEQYVRNEAIPQVRGLYEAIVGFSNTRHAEGQAALQRAEARASAAANAALILYVIGTVLVLGGQYIDKVVKGKKNTEFAAPASPAAPTSK